MYPALKSFFDFLFSLAILLLVLPLLTVVCLWLLVSNSGQIFFVQSRPGHKGKVFSLYKFKTMTDARDSTGRLLPDMDRLTSAGRFIRSTSLDELPQLLNVLKGDMSLIGPRPLLVKYLPLYNERQARRHEVKPGITGWAQVNGRNTISWQERFELDVYYVDHLSFWLDLKILLLTIKNVLKREGINAKGSATMEAFKGN